MFPVTTTATHTRTHMQPKNTCIPLVFRNKSIKNENVQDQTFKNSYYTHTRTQYSGMLLCRWTAKLWIYHNTYYII